MDFEIRTFFFITASIAFILISLALIVIVLALIRLQRSIKRISDKLSFTIDRAGHGMEDLFYGFRRFGLAGLFFKALRTIFGR